MTIRVAINGFGRIGRNLFRAAKQSGADIDFVAVNDLGSVDTMAHLLKHDSVLGALPYDVEAVDDGFRVVQDARPVAVDAVTLPYPGLATDLQPLVMALNSIADGAAMITEAG